VVRDAHRICVLDGGAIVEFADGKIRRETRYYGRAIEVDRREEA